MKTNTLIIMIFFAVGITNNLQAQSADRLLGKCTPADLTRAPYAEWFESYYKGYQPDVNCMDQLQQLDVSDISIEVFLGTWCNDTKRQVPPFLRVLDDMSFNDSNLTLIGVDSGKRYKLSPTGETEGKSIYRVPTFIVYRAGKEIGRIVEFPSISHEMDLLHILSGKPIIPHFPVYTKVDEWLENGALSCPNISLKSLALQIRPFLYTQSDLYAGARTLFARGLTEEALVLYRVNNFIYFEEPDTYISLAKAYQLLNRHQEAATVLENCHGLSMTSDQWKEALQLFAESKHVKSTAF